jgi:L-amino acid N-acyltransferase YncA
VPEKLIISPMSAEDWPAVRAIYQEGIATEQATFETSVPSWSEWDAARRPDCRLVMRRNNEVLGWAALNAVSRRAVYAGVAEVGIYVTEKERGRGVGRSLLSTLIETAEEAGIWTLQASIFPENEASVGLFHACGFRTVGRRERIAKQHGLWRDTLLLERRSEVVGEN